MRQPYTFPSYSQALALVAAILLLVTGCGNAPTPSTTTPIASGASLKGSWVGQGAYYNGEGSFPLTLNLTINGTTITGTLQYFSGEVSVSGTVNSSSGDTAAIQFNSDSVISGEQIELDTTYTATVNGGHMTGTWYYSGDTSPDGTFSLTHS
jgi:hypothetical protein